MREQGHFAFRNSQYPDAIKLYACGIEMALDRPVWEPVMLLRDEVDAMYTNYAKAYLGLQMRAEGAGRGDEGRDGEGGQCQGLVAEGELSCGDEQVGGG